ncbi:MAG: PaaI family thioesterase [Chloroflexi bacterium]|nr:PaaI family thioesterase [Chloroflexota bacterium]
MTSGPALQDLIPRNHCWGCSPHNEDGLQIKSYWDGDQAVCVWQSRAPFFAGPTHVLNGGIVATLIDCHSVITAIADAYRAEGRDVGSPPDIWCATAALNITYLRPAPIDAPLTLCASVQDRGERRTTVVCTLSANGEECARGEVVAVRVPESWRDRSATRR